jgi:hypothetical protein
MRVALAVIVLALISACGSFPPGGGGPPTEPTPPPLPVPPESEQCHVTGASFSCYDNPPDGESFPEWEPNWGYVCPPIEGVTTRVGVPENCPAIPELPQPQCASFTDRGSNLRVLGDACDCYLQEEWIECPVEPPPVTDCPTGFPQGVPNGDFEIGPVMTNFAPTVNTAMRTLTGCEIGSDCPTNMGPDDWMHSVIDMVKLTGLCAGRHVDTTPGGTDEIAVTNNCAGWWEGYKIYNYGGGKVIWSPNANRPAYRIGSANCDVGGPVEPPTEPPPGGGVCEDPNPRGLPARFDCQRVGNGNKITCTYKITEGRSYCDQVCSPIEPDVCYTGRNACPVRIEGDPERVPCERSPDVIGVQQWWCEGQPNNGSTENPAQSICSGEARTCTEDGDTCEDIDARP